MEGQAYISDQACVHAGAVVLPGAYIGPGVELASGVTVGPNAVLGMPSPDGPSTGTIFVDTGCWIGPGACIEPDCRLEPEVVIGPGCVIRSASRIARGARLSHRCTLMGNCTVGHDARLLAEVYICELAVLGPHCHLMPGVKLLNDPYPPTALKVQGPVIGSCAVLGVNAVIWPGVTIGYHAMVAASSEVKHHVPDWMLVRGVPAEPVCDVRMIRMKLGDKWVYPYPWMRHGIEGEDITRPVRASTSPPPGKER